MKEFLEKVIFWTKLKGNPLWELEWQEFNPHPTNSFREGIFLDRWYAWRKVAIFLFAMFIGCQLFTIALLLFLSWRF